MAFFGIFFKMSRQKLEGFSRENAVEKISKISKSEKTASLRVTFFLKILEIFSKLFFKKGKGELALFFEIFLKLKFFKKKILFEKKRVSL